MSAYWNFKSEGAHWWLLYMGSAAFAPTIESFYYAWLVIAISYGISSKHRSNPG